MKLVRSLKLMLLLPLVMAMIITLGIVYVNIDTVSAKFNLANTSQTEDLEKVRASADFARLAGKVQEKFLQTLEEAKQSSHLQRYQSHAALVDMLAEMSEEIDSLVYTELLHKDKTHDEHGLYNEYSNYQQFVIQASETVISHPEKAPGLLEQASRIYVDFSLMAATTGVEMSGAAKARNVGRAQDFSYTNQRLLLISVAVLLIVLLATHMLTRGAGRDMVDLTEGLGALTENVDSPEALSRIEALRNRGSQEIQHLATALLNFSQAQAKQREAEEKAFELAFFDPLTKLPNRRMLSDRIKQVHINSQHVGAQAALLVLDIDNFKAINDLFGHGAGDKTLQQVARRLSQKAPATSTVARVGGNAFAILVPNLTEGNSQIISLAEKIMFALGRPLELAEKKHFLTASLGVSLFGADLEDMDAPLKNAEAAMYLAKGQGLNKVHFYDPSIQAKLQEQLLLEGDLRQALAREQLQLYYQAQANAEGGIVGFEALLRWIHPERGMVSPGAFIPMAEGSELILPIGHWVLRTACQLLQDWSADPQRNQLTVAVNVSARQFLQGDFVNQVRTELDKTGINPRCLKLELTESLVLEDVESTIQKMQELRDLGVLLSMDDFGTGYSSLQYLKRLPVDQLKIDQAFVQDIATSSADAAIAQTIVAMGYALGMEVIAEGVETTEQQQALMAHGCKYFQGYLFSRPLPRPDMESFLQTHLLQRGHATA